MCLSGYRLVAYKVICCELSIPLGDADVFLETERKVSRMFSLEERSRAVELYLTTPMTTAQVVECLGYPTRQCLERWLAMDPRYAGRMAKPIIPLETRRKAIELVLGGMQQKQAAKQLGVSVGACFASMFVRQVRQCFSAVWADGFPRCRHRFPVM